MDARQLQALDRRLADFLSTLTASMGRSERRRWAEVYVRGLLLDGERKSIGPLAARAGGDVQGLQQFIGQSPWAAEAVQQALNARMSAALAPSAYWIVDETSFPKQGAHSVGVARQYCGTLGKIAKCQVAVSLHWSNGAASWPPGWRLYLPESWADDAVRRKKAGVPASVTHASKSQLALELIESVRAQGVPLGVVLADSFYGDGFAWRAQLHAQGLGLRGQRRGASRRLAGRRPGRSPPAAARRAKATAAPHGHPPPCAPPPSPCQSRAGSPTAPARPAPALPVSTCSPPTALMATASFRAGARRRSSNGPTARIASCGRRASGARLPPAVPIQVGRAPQRKKRPVSGALFEEANG